MNETNAAQWVFRLFLSGKSPKNERSIAILEQLCEKHLEGKCHIEVIDITQDPLAGIEANILATPTLIKKLPEPAQRLIGDLSDKEKLLLSLEIIVKE